MTTANTIIATALRKLNAVDASESLNAADFESGRDALNRMLTRWEANGLAMGWQNIATPTDVVPIPPEGEQAVIYNLALDLAPEYGKQPSPLVLQIASEELSNFRRDRYVASPVYTESDEPRSLHGRWNIYTDSPARGC